jgi:hypothetical protein
MVSLRPKAEVDLLEIWDFIFRNSDTKRADVLFLYDGLESVQLLRILRSLEAELKASSLA